MLPLRQKVQARSSVLRSPKSFQAPFKALHKLQCSRTELDEMLAVCVYMGGGPALMYTAEAIKAWDEMAPQ